MTITGTNKGFQCFSSMIFLLICTSGLNAQDWHQVWADEFNDPEIDRAVWSFDSGPANDNVHYFTNREENARIDNGILHLIAQEEPYEGFNYTAALLKTRGSAEWRYGRIEARIKLPGTNGFVPAFWMMPANDRYGWWSLSGEIDIMEHPTNQVSTIYGTVHTGAYNSFTGSGPRGSHTQIYDAEIAFHVYAIEWTADKMDFYVDERRYFTFYNDHTGFETWPFDQPFYIILSMGVGGGWVGPPDATSVFPAVMEVDYVRVFQDMNDLTIHGPDDLPTHSEATLYSLPDLPGAVYSWRVPSDARIVFGQSTPQITVDWDRSGGTVEAEVRSNGRTYTMAYPVTVSSNLLRNSGFETGVKYWNRAVGYPAAADFSLETRDVREGLYSLCGNVKTPGTNMWDIQVSQQDLFIEAGKQYTASFWAKTNQANIQINAAIMDVADYFLYAIETVTVTDTWTQYELAFTANANATVAFNIDMGGRAGRFYLDDFLFTTPESSIDGQLINGDFSNGDQGWSFNVFDQAQATGSVQNGQYVITITNGGINPWDVHLGQADVLIEKRKKYTVSFDAYAAAPRDISFIVGRNSDPWTVYNGNQTMALTTTKQTYTHTFTMTNPTDPQARLGFDVGKSSINVYFDNVLLNQAEEAEDPVVINPKPPR